MNGQQTTDSRQPTARTGSYHSPLAGESVGGRSTGGGSSLLRPIALLTLVLTLVTAACGDDDSASSTTEQSTTTVAATTTVAPATTKATTTTEASTFPVTVLGTEIPEMPERIVSLSATHTEVLYEIGAGDEIIATDIFSDHPAAALETEKVDAFNLSVEAVAALDPDLVILSYDPGDAMSGFAALSIPAILFAPPGPATLVQVYDEWELLGIATGHEEEAQALTQQVSDDIQAVVDEVPQTIRSFTYFVELDSTLFTAGPDSLLSSIFGLLGMTNIVGEDAGAFPQVSSEFLLDADPDFIFLADTVCCGQSAETVAQRPGWESLSAVRNGTVVELDDSIASRWSHRVLQLVTVVAAEVYGIG